MENNSVGLYMFNPTVVGESFLPEYVEDVKKFYNSHSFDASTGNITGELNGKISVHLEKDLKKFFTDLKTRIKDYLKHFGVDTNLFDINIVKSWYVKCDSNFNLPKHCHSCSHISFSYYLDVKENDPLMFSINNPNEWFENSFNESYIQEFHQFNSYTYGIQPTIGSLLIFPGKLNHFTNTENRDYIRMCLSGDIVLTLKDDLNNFESGLVSNKNWG